jgi:hypothetical protein
MLGEIIQKLRQLKVCVENPNTDLVILRKDMVDTMEKLAVALEQTNEKLDVIVNGKVPIVRENVHSILQRLNILL